MSRVWVQCDKLVDGYEHGAKKMREDQRTGTESRSDRADRRKQVVLIRDSMAG